MQEENSHVSDEAFRARIESLSPKQKEAALHIFAAAKRKGMQEMTYSRNWILECIIMKMKGPRLYEHLGKQQILVLQTKATLQNYLRSYRSGFGFNTKVRNELLKQSFNTPAGEVIMQLFFISLVFRVLETNNIGLYIQSILKYL